MSIFDLVEKYPNWEWDFSDLLSNPVMGIQEIEKLRQIYEEKMYAEWDEKGFARTLVITPEIIQKLRDVQDFPSIVALKQQIRRDIAKARAILKTC